MLWPEKKELSHIILPETKYVAIKVEQARGAVRSLSTHARRSSNLPEVASSSLAVSNFTHSSIRVISATWTVSEITSSGIIVGQDRQHLLQNIDWTKHQNLKIFLGNAGASQPFFRIKCLIDLPLPEPNTYLFVSGTSRTGGRTTRTSARSRWPGGRTRWSDCSGKLGTTK